MTVSPVVLGLILLLVLPLFGSVGILGLAAAPGLLGYQLLSRFDKSKAVRLWGSAGLCLCAALFLTCTRLGISIVTSIAPSLGLSLARYWGLLPSGF